MEQQQPGEIVPADNNSEPPSPPPARRDSDDTWGQGSATALENLRRQNFRGHRLSIEDDRPSSD